VFPVLVVTALLAATAVTSARAPANAGRRVDGCRNSGERSLDGSCNNLARPGWGRIGSQYRRVAAPNYADGIGAPVTGPDPRYVSNRIFNDTAQNLFSENGVTQWGFVWGQFMDHTIGLREDTGGEDAPLPFGRADGIEEFQNDLGAIAFSRTPAAPGTGTGRRVRQQINTVSSYIDGFSVYSGKPDRLAWLRDGAKLMLDDGFLPRRDARGDAANAPVMALEGRLRGTPGRAMVAGDERANENIALTATHTLFAREHNRIVDALPDSLSEPAKFAIARRVIGAEQQYVTYHEFLPAMGVSLAPYGGYNRQVNTTLSNEFAVVGYRAHSMIHGEMEPNAPIGTYTQAQLDAFEAKGIEVEEEDGNTVLVIPLNLAFFNPDLLADIGLGPVLKGIGGEPEYKNDEQIDNQLRSVLFQVPVPGNPACLDGPTLPACFRGVVDLGAIDIARGRDHGLPRYNQLRRAYGLPAKRGFASITGEQTSSFPAGDPDIDPADPINDPDIMDFVHLFNAAGAEIALGTPEAETDAVRGVRRTALAARLRAVYGDVDRLDAFVGMIAEPHLPGSDLGPLQHAIWKKQFEALRDGDRFFYLNDPVLREIRRQYGIDYQRTLGQIITDNTGVVTQPDVFRDAG
jgi:hypothetical protein